jgi:DNA-binding NtrC family response regulator
VSAKITFLEDNEDLRVLISRLLKSKLDLDTVCVSSIHDLIEHFEEVLASDLVILDINLGTEENGMDAYKWLRDQGFKGKVFFLTGYGETNPIVSMAQKQGVDVYQKPIETRQLVNLVSNALNIH